MTEGASSEDADLYIGRYSVETGESQEFGIESFTAVSDEARLVINENLVVYMYCSSDEQGSMIMKIELFDFDNNTKKLLSTNTVHNVFGYAKQISDEEAVFLLYEQVGDDTEQILLYYNLTTEELREIYRGEDIYGYSEGSLSSKDIWAIDTDGGNIYLLMQQYENTQMKFYLRVIDTQGNTIQETGLEALSMYNTIGDTADSLIVKGNYVILHYSQWTKKPDNTNAPVSILCKEDSGYKALDIESTVRPKNLYLGKADDTPYVFFNTVDKKEELFILNTETGEEITLTLFGDGIRSSAVDSNGNLLVETRVDDKTEWYLFGGDSIIETTEENISCMDAKLNIDNYYLSLTGSFNNEDSVLSEVYAVYDFSEKTTEKLLSVEATSTYPCGVCDLPNNIVYYSAAEESDIGERSVMLDNVYAYDTNTHVTTQITDYGYYMNRMIPIGDKLYFAGGRRSSAAVEFGWIDLSDNTMAYPECYSDVKTINVRDIAYACADEAVYVSWYSLSEQSRLDKENRDSASRKLAENHLDRFNITDRTILSLESFSDFRIEKISLSQNGKKIFMYGENSETPMRLRDNDMTSDFKYPGSALAVMSPDGTALYFISVSEKQNNGVPCTILNKYDFLSGSTEEAAYFDFYVNNMILLHK